MYNLIQTMPANLIYLYHIVFIKKSTMHMENQRIKVVITKSQKIQFFCQNKFKS